MQTADFPIIETERLLLREIVLDDVPALFAIHGDRESMKWFGSDPLPDEAAAAKLVELFAGWRALANPGTRWGLQLKGQEKLIGTCGLFAWNRNWRRCTVGYELYPEARGRGYMQEALRAVIAWGWGHMQLNRIEAQVHPENADSLRSLAKLGFKREGLLRQAGYWSERYHDLYQYSLLRDEWKSSTLNP
ncbi:GNAT family N-acetyltransferase [Pseudoduganella violaceinigra]|uniref:GNAT family N-acetyltransferase n=1 Tax=Pseudoduganella violaceinigra TaxID=246602 RepID=UPI00048579A2|nr:GNAT family protein [Pseudoduganella violaceinigra]